MIRKVIFALLGFSVILLAAASGELIRRVVVASAVAEQQPPAQERAASQYLRNANDSVRSRHLLDAGVGAADLGTTLHAINVAAGAATGTSTIDAASAGGKILGVYWAGNQDQFVDNVVLNANGSVTVTLAANAVAINNVRVVVAHGVPRQ